MAVKKSDQRSLNEKLFLVVFFPAVLIFYVIHKYPHWMLGPDGDLTTFHLLGKSPGFWYGTVYTGLVCGTCLWVLISNRNQYQRSKKKGPLSTYQRNKFRSILIIQFVAFYFAPYVLPGLRQDGEFFNDPGRVATKAAHVYVFRRLPARVWLSTCSW